MNTDDRIVRLNAALDGRYRIERQLGEGGMATVYLARDEKHNRNVALKVLKPELAAVVGAERFLAEIETTANLQHPHILPLFDSGEADTFLFYVMPYVEGESLRERLDREHQLPVDEAVQIAKNVAEALDYAHRHGVIHRDIKPANILLQDAKPVVSDFGIALALGAAGAGRLTETGLSLGTPHYMSPEQATGDLSVGAASDIYAVGCVLFEMLVGEPPYTGRTPQAVLGKIVTGQPDSVRQHRPSVPTNIDGAVHKALEKVPADRFGSGKEFAGALADPTFRYGESAVPTGSPPVTRWRTVAIAALLVAVVATASVAATIIRSSGATPARAIRVTLASSATGTVRPIGETVAILPDGSGIVFAGDEDGRVRLYHRALADRAVAPIAGTEDATSAFAISPDGRSVAFWSPDREIKRVSLEGGSPISVVDMPNPPIGLDWSAEYGLVTGMLSYTTEPSFYGMLAVQGAGEPIRPVTRPEWMHHDSYVLPGGRSALTVDVTHERAERMAKVSLADGSMEFLDLGDTAPRSVRGLVGVADDVLLFIDVADNLMAVGWDARTERPVGVPQPVPDVPAGLRSARVAADGTLAMYVSAEAYEVLLVGERGDPVRTVSDVTVDAAYPRFSPDGQRIAIGAPFQGEPELWIYDLRSDLPSQLSMGFPPSAIAWTPDGGRVLAAIGRGGGAVDLTRVWSRAADASDEPRILLDLEARRIWGLDVGPDTRTLAVVHNTGSSTPGTELLDIDIVEIVELGDEIEITPFAAGAANELAPRFSPDGRWLAYASDESGRFEVYVRPFPGPGPRLQVSQTGAGQPVWSADGARLYYRTQQAIWVAELGEDAGGGRLSVTARTRLFDGDFFGGPEFSKATYDVNPDGSTFIVARAARGSATEIVAWIDWLPQLKRRLFE